MEQVRFCRRLQRTIRLVCEVASGHRPRPDHRHDRKLSDWIALEDIHEHTGSAGWYEKTRLQISLFHAEVGRPDTREINRLRRRPGMRRREFIAVLGTTASWVLVAMIGGFAWLQWGQADRAKSEREAAI